MNQHAGGSYSWVGLGHIWLEQQVEKTRTLIYLPHQVKEGRLSINLELWTRRHGWLGYNKSPLLPFCMVSVQQREKTYWFGLDFFGIERFEELGRPLQLQALLCDSQVAHAVLSTTQTPPTLASAPRINPDVAHTHFPPRVFPTTIIIIVTVETHNITTSRFFLPTR